MFETKELFFKMFFFSKIKHLSKREINKPRNPNKYLSPLTPPSAPSVHPLCRPLRSPRRPSSASFVRFYGENGAKNVEKSGETMETKEPNVGKSD
jgi:hypothetical protein